MDPSTFKCLIALLRLVCREDSGLSEALFLRCHRNLVVCAICLPNPTAAGEVARLRCGGYCSLEVHFRWNWLQPLLLLEAGDPTACLRRNPGCLRLRRVLWRLAPATPGAWGVPWTPPPFPGERGPWGRRQAAGRSPATHRLLPGLLPGARRSSRAASARRCAWQLNAAGAVNWQAHKRTFTRGG